MADPFDIVSPSYFEVKGSVVSAEALNLHFLTQIAVCRERQEIYVLLFLWSIDSLNLRNHRLQWHLRDLMLILLLNILIDIFFMNREILHSLRFIWHWILFLYENSPSLIGYSACLSYSFLLHSLWGWSPGLLGSSLFFFFELFD
jgi:hypothetical protein